MRRAQECLLGRRRGFGITVSPAGSGAAQHRPKRQRRPALGFFDFAKAVKLFLLRSGIWALRFSFGKSAWRASFLPCPGFSLRFFLCILRLYFLVQVLPFMSSFLTWMPLMPSWRNSFAVSSMESSSRTVPMSRVAVPSISPSPPQKDTITGQASR